MVEFIRIRKYFMDTRRFRKSNRAFNVVVTGFVIILCVTFSLIWLRPGSYRNSVETSYSTLQYMWTDEDGTPAMLDELEGEQSFYFVLNGESINNRDLCFCSKNTNFKVYLDDQMIYSYEPKIPAIFGRSYGLFYHAIPLPEYEGAKTVRIDTEAAYSGGNGYLRQVQLQYGNVYYVDLYASNTMNFLVAVFMFAIGVILLFGGAAVAGSSGKGREIISMGLFTMMASTWVCSQTVFFQLSSNNPAAVHFMGYIMLILLPGVAMLFISSYTGRHKSISTRIMVWVSVFLCLLDVAVTLSGVADYHNMLFLTHIQIAVAIALSAYNIVAAGKRREIRRRATRILISAFLVAMIGATADLIRYYWHETSTDSAFFFRMGLLTYVVVMSTYEARELYKYRKYAMEADTMRKLAHTDALTGIANRMAFTEFENTIRDSVSEDILLVQLDINYLKKVNDVYGHVEGDKHIAAAASIIHDCFAESGRVFRTGGDEFIATVEGIAGKARYNDAINKMEKEIARYNKANKPPVPLQIAYGMAEYDPDKSTPEETLKKADDRMYSMKTHMKEEK